MQAALRGNGEERPIDVLRNDPEGWQGWNSYRSNKDDFDSQSIFSLAQGTGTT